METLDIWLAILCGDITIIGYGVGDSYGEARLEYYAIKLVLQGRRESSKKVPLH